MSNLPRVGRPIRSETKCIKNSQVLLKLVEYFRSVGPTVQPAECKQTHTHGRYRKYYLFREVIMSIILPIKIGHTSSWIVHAKLCNLNDITTRMNTKNPWHHWLWLQISVPKVVNLNFKNSQMFPGHTIIASNVVNFAWLINSLLFHISCYVV